jgi:Putative auto-transporter adhesin, head GIN domain
MKKIKFIIGMLTILVWSCSKPVTVRPSGNITKVTIPISNFTGIQVRNGMQLFVTKDTVEKIVIETDDNIQDLYTAQKIGSNVDIRLNQTTDFRPEQVVKVFISAKNLVELVAASGCIVKFNNTIPSNDFNLKLSDGSVFNGAFSATTLTANITSGCKATLTGTTNKFTLVASAGCQVNDFDFKSNILDCKISDGTTVNTTVNTTIDVVATDGAVLNFKGNAVVNSKTINSGGQVNKL